MEDGPLRSLTLRSSARVVVSMSRPPQLGAVSLVYLLGVLMAGGSGGSASLTTLLIGWLALLFVAASIHLANEYADAETDALTRRTFFSGGSGALAATGAPRELALRAAGFALAIGAGCALLAAIGGAFPPLALGLLILGAGLGWMYSLPPLALAWRGWGEALNALLGGMLLPLFGFTVVSGRLEAWALAGTLPLSVLVFVNLLATTWPDRGADALVGKWTLATRWAQGRLRRTYLLSAGMGVLLLLLGSGLPDPVARTSLLVLPLIAWGAASYTRVRSPFPSVAAMISLILLQILAWWSISGGFQF